MKTFSLRKDIYILVFVITSLLNISLSYSQTYNTNSTYSIYQEAEKLYRLGKNQASIDFIYAKAKDLANTNDSLLYLQIVNLARIYKTDNKLTVLLEGTTFNFLQCVHKDFFPDNLYNEVVAVYIKLIRFQNADNAFYASANQHITQLNINTLKSRNDSIQKYIFDNPNSYYLAELNNLYINNSNSIAVIEKEILKRQNDSISLKNLRKVGKIHTLSVSYSFPSHNAQKLTFDELGDVSHFFNGNNDSIFPLVPDLALGLSLVNIGINLYTTKRFKLSIDWSILDIKYHMFNIENSVIKPKPYDLTYLEKLQSFCIGTRIGLMVPVSVTNHIAIAPYFNIVPAFCFLYNPMGFVVNSDNSSGYKTGSYEIKPKTDSFNLSYEYGFRIYLYENKYVSAYMQNGNFNWINTITWNSFTDESYKTHSDYKYQVFGIRIGF
jgi:hypothetical protein